jgi:hypothetical protein
MESGGKRIDRMIIKRKGKEKKERERKERE